MRKTRKIMLYKEMLLATETELLIVHFLSVARTKYQ